MDFAEVLRTFLEGQRMGDASARYRRVGWNGQGMHVQLVSPSGGMTLWYICIRTAAGEWVPWAPSQCDLLSRDWEPAS